MKLSQPFLRFSKWWIVILLFCLKVFLQTSSTTHIPSEYDKDSIFQRQKRQVDASNFFTVELLFVTDYAIFEWYYNLSDPGTSRVEETVSRIQKHYFEVLDGINSRYEGLQTDNFKINVTLARLLIPKNTSFTYWTESNKLPPAPGSRRWMVPASLALDSFLQWVNQTDLPRYDHAILFTGYNLTYGGSGSYRGLSFPDSVCSPDAISIVEDTFDTKTAITATQELGRSLGSRQDLDGNFCLAFLLNVMTPETNFEGQYVPNLWEFSTCSVTYFEEFLEPFRQGESCLTSLSNTPQQSPLMSTTDSADQQCRNVYGTGSFVCRALIRFDYSSVCRGLPCWDDSAFSCPTIIPYDGTVCGNNSVCSGGVCISSEEGIEVRDECPYGDQPILPNSAGCDIRIYNQPYDCYIDALRAICCQSCDDIQTDIANCTYGDRIATCNSSLCTTYDNTTRFTQCCLTCTNGKAPFSASSLLPSTTTPSTSFNSTSADNFTYGNVTSGENITILVTTEETSSTEETIMTTMEGETEGTTLIRRSTPSPPEPSSSVVPTSVPETTTDLETRSTYMDTPEATDTTESFPFTDVTSDPVASTTLAPEITSESPPSTTEWSPPTTDTIETTITTTAPTSTTTISTTTTSLPTTTALTSTSSLVTTIPTTSYQVTSEKWSSSVSSAVPTNSPTETTHSQHVTMTTTAIRTTSGPCWVDSGSSSDSHSSESGENARSRAFRVNRFRNVWATRRRTQEIQRLRRILSRRVQEIQRLRSSWESRFGQLQRRMKSYHRRTSRRLGFLQRQSRSRFNFRGRFRNSRSRRRRCDCDRPQIITVIREDDKVDDETDDKHDGNINDPYT